MTDNDKSLDLTGMGKLAKAIPSASWNKLVKTACDTFSQILAPITSTTTGLGRLIEAKFDGMLDAQKVLAAEALRRAQNKVDGARRQCKGPPKAKVLIKALEAVSQESDDNMREIWANLIANELLDNRVHPEFPKILEKLSSEDALTLADIAESSKKSGVTKALRAFLYGLELRAVFVSYSPALAEEATDFSREHLQNLHLIRRASGQWSLTLIGESFIKTVADPSYLEEETEHPA